MMKRLSIWVIIAALIGISGCGKSSADGESAAKLTESQSKPDQAAKAAPKTLSDLPDSLKTDAFHYYGLANTTPVKMHIVRKGAATMEGDQTMAFKSLEGDKASFLTTRGGALADLGSEEVSLEPDGVYVVSSSVGDIGGKSLELPAVLKPGTTWHRASQITRSNGSKVKYDAQFKVVGIQKITTPAGDFDALLITSDGPAEIDGAKMQMSVKSWYVKDLGPVKISTQLTPAKGQPQSMVIEAIK